MGQVVESDTAQRNPGQDRPLTLESSNPLTLTSDAKPTVAGRRRIGVLQDHKQGHKMLLFCFFFFFFCLALI